MKFCNTKSKNFRIKLLNEIGKVEKISSNIWAQTYKHNKFQTDWQTKKKGNVLKVA